MNSLVHLKFFNDSSSAMELRFADWDISLAAHDKTPHHLPVTLSLDADGAYLLIIDIIYGTEEKTELLRLKWRPEFSGGRLYNEILQAYPNSNGFEKLENAPIEEDCFGLHLIIPDGVVIVGTVDIGVLVEPQVA